MLAHGRTAPAFGDAYAGRRTAPFDSNGTPRDVANPPAEKAGPNR